MTSPAEPTTDHARSLRERVSDKRWVQIVAEAKSLFNYEGSVIHKTSEDKDYLVDNPNRRCPDISKARRDLGYSPQISLSDGLRRSLIWYSENQEPE